MKLVISGAGGFLGRELLGLLVDRDPVSSVIALDLKIDHITNFSENSKIELFTNEDFLLSDRDLSDYTLINLAYARSLDFEPIKSSCEWTFALFEKLQASGCEKYINISSQSVYDPRREFPAKESDLPFVSELYDLGKYYLENWIREFSEKYGALHLNLRPSSLVGPNFPQRITSRLVKKALEDGEISINLNGQVFSYTHVNDLARALLAAADLDRKAAWNKVYNFGSDERYTIEDIAQCIEQVFQKNAMSLKVNRLPAAANRLNSSIDATLFGEATGWTVGYSLYDIVEEEFYEELGKRDSQLV
ncbi:MAG: NAD(P)-dependent oxidoreductase [Clostridiaceae bacterium]|nr:NAD(P)-dependent oxidoreductase [Clostridiaceae bacterium]